MVGSGLEAQPPCTLPHHLMKVLGFCSAGPETGQQLSDSKVYFLFWEITKGALDKYNIYLFISISTEDFNLKQF